MTDFMNADDISQYLHELRDLETPQFSNLYQMSDPQVHGVFAIPPHSFHEEVGLQSTSNIDQQVPNQGFGQVEWNGNGM